MNDTDLHELAIDDLAFAKVARARLRASESLNAVEAARLAAARARACELRQPSRRALPAWGWVAAPAALAVVALSMLRTASIDPAVVPPAQPETLVSVNADSGDALMWVSDEAGPDFYRDLEFYEWLQSRSPTEPNA